MKNRKRSPYSFANINFIGRCNFDCSFCLGKELTGKLGGDDFDSVHFDNFLRLDDFLSNCREQKIQQLYLTGLNTDPLLYKYLLEFVSYLKQQSFYVGIRTNGFWADEKIDILNQMTTCNADAVGYTLLSLNLKTLRSICNVPVYLDWNKIFANTHVPYRVSIVVTTENEGEVKSLIEFISGQHNSPKYIQIRKVATEHRINLMRGHQIAYDRVKSKYLSQHTPKETFELAPIISIGGIPVVFWETIATTVNSLNYFTNGVISENYFIIEGYEQRKQ